MRKKTPFNFEQAVAKLEAKTTQANAEAKLFEIVKGGSFDELSELYKECEKQGFKLNLNCKNKLGYTPLMWAIINGNIEVANFLVHQPSNIVDLNAQDNRGDTAFNIACFSGETLIATEIAKQESFDANLTNEAGRNALFQLTKDPFTSERDKRNIGRILLGRGNLNLNQQSFAGNTILHFAFRKSSLHGAIEAFIKAGADLTVRNNKGLTPIDGLIVRFNTLATRKAKQLISSAAADEEQGELLLNAALANPDAHIKISDFNFNADPRLTACYNQIVQNEKNIICEWFSSTITPYLTGELMDYISIDLHKEEENSIIKIFPNAGFKTAADLNKQHVEIFKELVIPKNTPAEQIHDENQEPEGVALSSSGLNASGIELKESSTELSNTPNLLNELTKSTDSLDGDTSLNPITPTKKLTTQARVGIANIDLNRSMNVLPDASESSTEESLLATTYNTFPITPLAPVNLNSPQNQKKRTFAQTDFRLSDDKIADPRRGKLAKPSERPKRKWAKKEDTNPKGGKLHR